MSRPGDTPAPVAPPEDEPPPARGRLVVAGLVVLAALLVAGLLVVGGSAAVLSFDAIADLGERAGWAEDRAHLLPLCLDAGSALGALVWLSRIAPSAVPFARVLCLSTLAASVLANIAGHAYGPVGPDLPLAVVAAIALVAPTILGACVHVVGLVIGDLRGTPAEGPDGAGRDESDDEQDPRPDSSWSDEALADDLRGWAADRSRPWPSRDAVCQAYGVGGGRAGRVRERAGVGADPTVWRGAGPVPAAGTEVAP